MPKTSAEYMRAYRARKRALKMQPLPPRSDMYCTRKRRVRKRASGYGLLAAPDVDFSVTGSSQMSTEERLFVDEKHRKLTVNSVGEIEPADNLCPANFPLNLCIDPLAENEKRIMEVSKMISAADSAIAIHRGVRRMPDLLATGENNDNISKAIADYGKISSGRQRSRKQPKSSLQRVRKRDRQKAMQFEAAEHSDDNQLMEGDQISELNVSLAGTGSEGNSSFDIPEMRNNDEGAYDLKHFSNEEMQQSPNEDLATREENISSSSRELPDSCGCKNKCFGRFTRSELKRLVDYSDELKEKELFDKYLLSLIKFRKIVRSPGCGDQRKKPKDTYYYYTVEFESKKVFVCKGAFISLHGITMEKMCNLQLTLKNGNGLLEIDKSEFPLLANAQYKEQLNISTAELKQTSTKVLLPKPIKNETQANPIDLVQEELQTEAKVLKQEQKPKRGKRKVQAKRTRRRKNQRGHNIKVIRLQEEKVKENSNLKPESSADDPQHIDKVESSEEKAKNMTSSSETKKKQLKDFPILVKSIGNSSDELLVNVYYLLFSTSSDDGRLEDGILSFSGFDFEHGSEQYNKRNHFLQGMTFKTVCAVVQSLCLSIFSTKDETIQNLLAFLSKPDESYLRMTVSPKVMSSAERVKAYRERRRARHLHVTKKTPKSNLERVRDYRARKKALEYADMTFSSVSSIDNLESVAESLKKSDTFSANGVTDSSAPDAGDSLEVYDSTAVVEKSVIHDYKDVSKSFMEEYMYSNASMFDEGSNSNSNFDESREEQRGSPLARFSKIVRAIENADYESIQVLYQLLYQRSAWDTQEILSHGILSFSGFNFNKTSEDYTNRELMLCTQPNEMLLKIGAMLGLEHIQKTLADVTKGRHDVIESIMLFLSRPSKKSRTGRVSNGDLSLSSHELPDKCGCRNKCYKKFTDDEKERLLEYTEELKEKSLYDKYLITLMESKKIIRQPDLVQDGKNLKEMYYNYKVKFDTREELVCKTAFMVLHDIKMWKMNHLQLKLRTGRARPSADMSEFPPIINDEFKEKLKLQVEKNIASKRTIPMPSESTPAKKVEKDNGKENDTVMHLEDGIEDTSSQYCSDDSDMSEVNDSTVLSNLEDIKSDSEKVDKSHIEESPLREDSSFGVNSTINLDDSQGESRGSSLSMFPKISRAIENTDYETLQLLYELIYQKSPLDTRTVLCQDVLSFSGFSFIEDSKDHVVRVFFLWSKSTEMLIKLGVILCVKIENMVFMEDDGRREIIESIMNFLHKPTRKSRASQMDQARGSSDYSNLPVRCGCKKRCMFKFSEVERQRLLEYTTELKDKHLLDKYLLSLMESKKIIRPPGFVSDGKILKGVYYHYKVKFDTKLAIVCKSAFMALHNVRMWKMNHLQLKMKTGKTSAIIKTEFPPIITEEYKRKYEESAITLS